MDDVVKDRYRGCLLGLAVGDALGAPFEFRPRGTFTCDGTMGCGGTWNLPPGYWTDDTSMALCLGDSILEKGGWDPLDQMERYVRWYRSGYNSSIGRCFDIGNQTSQALQKFERDYNNAIADHSSVNPFCGPTDDAYSGNGSLMRLAPVPMAYAYADVELLEKIAIDSSRTTHGSVACLTSCAEMAIIVARSLLTGQEATHLHHFEGMRGVPVEEVESSGYVCHTRDAAYWAVANHKTFRSALIAAVNLGGDTDTVGAVTGMLAGAIYGESSIPDEWLRILHRSKHIRSMADRLFAVAPR